MRSFSGFFWELLLGASFDFVESFLGLEACWFHLVRRFLKVSCEFLGSFFVSFLVVSW